MIAPVVRPLNVSWNVPPVLPAPNVSVCTAFVLVRLLALLRATVPAPAIVRPAVPAIVLLTVVVTPEPELNSPSAPPTLRKTYSNSSQPCVQFSHPCQKPKRLSHRPQLIHNL